MLSPSMKNYKYGYFVIDIDQIGNDEYENHGLESQGSILKTP